MKRAFFGIMAATLAAPSLVSAQLSEPTGTGLPESSIVEIIQALMQWLLYILGFFAVIGFVISGIMFLTAAGNEDQATKAKSYMIYSIVGVLVALLGLIILNAAQAWLGGGSRF